jgi:hypothetical protein
MTPTELEKRLATVEREVAKLQSERAAVPRQHPVHALDKIHGAFENDDSFREAMRLGRKWRASQRPKTKKPKAKRK